MTIPFFAAIVADLLLIVIALMLVFISHQLSDGVELLEKINNRHDKTIADRS